MVSKYAKKNMHRWQLGLYLSTLFSCLPQKMVQWVYWESGLRLKSNFLNKHIYLTMTHKWLKTQIPRSNSTRLDYYLQYLSKIQVFDSTPSQISAHYSTYYSTPNIGWIPVLFRSGVELFAKVCWKLIKIDFGRKRFNLRAYLDGIGQSYVFAGASATWKATTTASYGRQILMCTNQAGSKFKNLARLIKQIG